ncbi:hypothetical protein [Chitinophaga sp. Cy-1792]|uniref:hypothetical protein n=1 Tax=Chitinophaga sp. Cy-1792 TaxID=2608339 RepID=UPI0014220865|nr:hypothetical protein [Chitinophaga sp. Cy-1792]NIG54277.1 hypothetical protein [Chitinophaga sp. Cy-1792]
MKRKKLGFTLNIFFIGFGFFRLINMQESDLLWKKIAVVTGLMIFLGLAVMGLMQRKQAV